MLPCILPGSDPTETELNIVRTAFRGLKTAPTRTNLQGQTVESMSQDALYKYMHASQWLVCTVLLCELSTCPTESALNFLHLRLCTLPTEWLHLHFCVIRVVLVQHAH